MYSLNAPVPGAVSRRASEVADHLPPDAHRGRGNHSLLVKRLGTPDDEFPVLAARVREVLTDQAPVAVRVTGVEQFREATSGPSPVVYLAVESPGLVAIHERLCAHFDPVADVEGEEYTPHVTVGRGCSREAARRACAAPFDPHEWTVESLVFVDTRSGPAGRVSLPAGR